MEGGSLKRFEIEPVLLDTYICVYVCVCVWWNGRNRGVLHEQGRVVREKKVEEKAESHCFSRSWQSVCRSTPLERSHLPLYSVWSHRPASPRLFLSLVECLDFSTNPRINPPSSSGKPPGTRTLETSTISFPLTYTADPFTGVHAFAKELNQNNKQTWKSDYRGGPCLDLAWREIVRAIIYPLSLSLSFSQQYLSSRSLE